jgi:hypothetical protein
MRRGPLVTSEPEIPVGLTALNGSQSHDGA